MTKPILRRASNRLLHLLARFSPGATSFRPWLHRRRGARIGKGTFIGDDVYIDNEYPECIEVGDHVQISIRAVLIAHTRGPGSIVIQSGAFIGPNAVLICGAGQVLKIGEGAVIAAGAVITRSVAPRLYVAPPAVVATARVGTPLPLAKTMEEFRRGLTPLEHGDSNPSRQRSQRAEDG